MNRRQFNTAIAALGIATATHAQSRMLVEVLQLSRNGWIPNNDRLPVLIYRRAFNPSSTAADQMERTFTSNAWPPQWRNGVYCYHHYHSTAHEVLGFSAGSATLMLGGENGHRIEVAAGDVAVLPAGTGHCRLHASKDLLVIGAYPEDQHWDICREAPSVDAVTRMSRLPFPASDPVTGRTGRLLAAWKA